MYTAGAQHSSSRLSLWRPAAQENLLLCVNVAGPGWASQEKRSRPAHGWKGRPRSWQRSARWDQAFFFFSMVSGARWYPTLKPRQYFHTKTKINRTSGHTNGQFFFACPRVEGPTPQLATKRSLGPGVLFFFAGTRRSLVPDTKTKTIFPH